MMMLMMMMITVIKMMMMLMMLNDDDDDVNDDYQEKSDGLPPRLGSSLCTRPSCSTTCIEEKSRLQKRLDKHGQGCEQLE